MKTFRTVVAIGYSVLIAPAPLAAQYQPGSQSAPATSTPAATPPAATPGATPVMTSGFSGSVPQGVATATPLNLTLADAIRRGLQYNMGVLTSEQATRSVAAQRRRALSYLLPQINGAVNWNEQQTDLAAFGLTLPGIPKIVGPYRYVDARATLNQEVLNISQFRNARSAAASLDAARLNFRDSRELVVQAVANAYLAILADAARLTSTQADVATSSAEYTQASDQKKAGTIAGIDVLRAQVELKTQQQRAVVDANTLARDKLNLARAIGLPPGQEFSLTDQFPFSPVPPVTPEEADAEAYRNRPDYQAAEGQVRAAELARGAARAERYPGISFSANYGDIGENFNNSHGTFGVVTSLHFPIFDGGRISADVEAADATLKQRRDELGDLRGRIDFDVRTVLLNLKASADQVEVAVENADLASQTLVQARDRFAAGVTNNIEVVQAQEAVVTAQENLISSTYQHNLAKIALARAMGATETGLKKYLGGW